MQNNIRNTNLRFNLDKEQQRRAWEYLQTMDRQDFKSYSQVISLALVDYFDRYYRTQADPYLETRDSRLAREFVVALPIELDKDSNISLSYQSSVESDLSVRQVPKCLYSFYYIIL